MTDSIHWRTPPRFAVAVGLVFAVGAQQTQSHRVGEPFEVFAGEVLVGQQDLPGTDEVVVVLQQGGHHLAFPRPRPTVARR